MNEETLKYAEEKYGKSLDAWRGCPEGWGSIGLELLEALSTLPEWPNIKFAQVKQKFGGLRVYLDGPGSPEIYSCIREAEGKAERTCEYCGAPGFLRETRGWLHTACDEHRSK